MAQNKRGLPDVKFRTKDNNLKNPTVESDQEVSGLIFDISTQPNLFKKGYGKDNIRNIKAGDIISIRNVDDLEDFGIIPYTTPEEGKQPEDVNFMYGVPYYHIAEFYRGRQGQDCLLYIMFADCSKDFNAVSIIQNATGGIAYQIGIYTEQALFSKEGTEDGTYALRLVESLETKARELEEDHAPAVILLQANPSVGDAETADTLKVDIDKIPNAVKKERSRVSIILGQANHSSIAEMQKANPKSVPVGALGIALGFTSIANVCYSIGWVAAFNMFGERFQRVEFGFGDLNKDTDGEFISTNRFESFVRRSVLDTLADKGYIFPIKYAGKPDGIHFNGDSSLSSGDFDSISNNRTIFKTERLVRLALLPFLNGSVTVSNVDGTLTAVSIADYTNAINRALDPMIGTDISGKKVVIDPKQKILENDVLYISYSILPRGKSKYIDVTNAYSTNTK